MRRTLSSILALTAACLGPLGTARAAITGLGQPAAPRSDCIIVLEDGAAGTLYPVEQCGPGRFRTAEASGAAHLMTWYADADFGGWSQMIWGKYGTCDRSGYRFDTSNGFGFWERNLSSYRLYGGCYYSEFTNHQGEYSDHVGDVAYVGDRFNDNIVSLRAWAR